MFVIFALMFGSISFKQFFKAIWYGIQHSCVFFIKKNHKVRDDLDVKANLKKDWQLVSEDISNAMKKLKGK
jgi:hypothetical protein